MRALILIISVFCLLQVGCGESSSTDPATVAAKPASDSSEGVDACELLNEKLIRSHFEVGDAEIWTSSAVRHGWATCRLGWSRPEYPELQAEYKAKVTEWGKAKDMGQDVQEPKRPREANELSLTMSAERHDNSAQAISALDTALDIMKYGLKSRPKDPAKVASINIQPVEGLGDKAAWTTPNNQISVANERRMFHLNVNVYTDSEANRVKAMELANLFLEDIR